MKQEQQQDAFAKNLGKLIDRYAAEFNLTYSSILGVLLLQQGKLVKEVLKDE